MLLIQNGYIKTMTGADIECGAVLIGDDGKIAAVGKDIAAPAGATVVDAGGRLVTPCCVDAHCHIGMEVQAVRWEGNDVNERSDPLTPHLRAIDAIYPQDPMFAEEAEKITRPPELDMEETPPDRPTLDDYVPEVESPVDMTVEELIEEAQRGDSDIE